MLGILLESRLCFTLKNRMNQRSKNAEWVSPSFSFRQRKAQWGRFLNEAIYLDKGIYNILPRHEAISIFVNEGIYPFVENNGYTWKLTEKQMTNTILNILFQMKLGNMIDIPNLQKGFTMEHYDRFLQTLDSEVLENFWYRWGELEDFEEDGYAYRFRFLLQNLIWNSLYLEHSRVIQEFEEEIKEQRAFEEALRRGTVSKGKEDPYLQDIQQGLGVRDKHNY